MVETLGPALFSTPDIIRRVSGSGNEMKNPDNPVGLASSTTLSTTVPTETVGSSPSATTAQPQQMIQEPMDTSINVNDSINDSLMSKLDATDASMLSETLENDKLDGKSSMIDLFQPAFDSGIVNYVVTKYLFNLSKFFLTLKIIEN